MSLWLGLIISHWFITANIFDAGMKFNIKPFSKHGPCSVLGPGGFIPVPTFQLVFKNLLKDVR